MTHRLFIDTANCLLNTTNSLFNTRSLLENISYMAYALPQASPPLAPHLPHPQSRPLSLCSSNHRPSQYQSNQRIQPSRILSNSLSSIHLLKTPNQHWNHSSHLLHSRHSQYSFCLGTAHLHHLPVHSIQKIHQLKWLRRIHAF